MSVADQSSPPTEFEGLRPAEAFSLAERKAVYRALETRRDVRSQFLPDALPDDVLSRILRAAHCAPSVGLMQPWNFILIRDLERRRRIHRLFARRNAEAATMFEAARASRYRSMKLEGILTAPLNVCVTCDRSRRGPIVLGRTHQRDTDIYSTVCAVQNIWIAARSEGVGVGWVSIFDPQDLKSILRLPDEISVIAFLCIGYVDHLHDRPELELNGWSSRLDLRDLIFDEHWKNETKLKI